jgi:internalin A
MTQYVGVHDYAKATVGKAWFGLTLARGGALLGMVSVYITALTLAFSKFHALLEASRADSPIVFWTLITLPLMFVASFSVGPQLWRQYEAFRRSRLSLVTDFTLPAQGYFRLEPYAPISPDDFDRVDHAHVSALKWVTTSSRFLLFLSGLSGVGKSSILEGYIVPKLRETGWKITVIRGFGDILSPLEGALRSASSESGKYLIILDQFEEFIINQEREKTDRGTSFIQALQAIRDVAPLNAKILLVIRSDYLNGLLDLNLDRLISRENWIDIDPFRRSAARRFLASSPLQPSEALVNQILDGIEAVEEARGLYRPITLNMVGLALSFFDTAVTRSPNTLIQDYLIQAMTQVGIREICPRVLELLITEAGTKRPMLILELARLAGLKPKEVDLSLSLLAAKGIVRPLNEERTLWEISHDFVAKQLSILLRQMRFAKWTRYALWSLPFCFVIALSVFTYIYPTYIHEQTLHDLQQADVSLSSDGDGNVMATIGESDDDPKDLPLVARLSRRYGATALDLSVTTADISNLSFLANYDTLRALRLCTSTAKDLRPLSNLRNLTMLELSQSSANDLRPLVSLQSLQTLYLPFTEVRDLRPLIGVAESLSVLDLEADDKITDFRPIGKLRNLTDLTLSRTQFADSSILESLTKLQSVELSWTPVSDIAGLKSLQQLNYLDLTGIQSLDFSVLASLHRLSRLILSDSSVNDLSFLARDGLLTDLMIDGAPIKSLDSLPILPNLRSIALTRTEVADLSPLLREPNLKSVGVGGTKVQPDSLPVVELRKRGIDVRFGAAGSPTTKSVQPHCHEFEF